MGTSEGGDRTFRRLWVGETLNLYVDQFVAFAAPLLVVTRLGGSVAEGQALTFLFFLPYLFLGLNAGVWLERRSKQRVTAASALAQTAVMLGILLAAGTGRLSMPVLAALVLASGVIAVFFQIAYQSYLPTIYSEHRDMVAGNAKLALSDAVTRVAGPASAGWLLGYAGVTSSFGVQLGLMVAATALFASLRRDPGSAESRQRAPTSVLIREGFTFVRRHAWLNPIIACGAYYTVFVTAIKTTVILYLVVSGKASESVAGLVTACIALGYGTGSVLARRSVARSGTRRTLQVSALISVCGLAVSAYATAVVSPSSVAVVVTAVGFLAHGIGDGIFAPTALSVRQVVTPAGLMSRVTSVHRFFIWGGMSLGALLGTAVTAGIGARSALLASGLLVVGTLPILYRRNFSLHPKSGETYERDPALALLHAE